MQDDVSLRKKSKLQPKAHARTKGAMKKKAQGVLGTYVPRKDGVPKVDGGAVYVDDMDLPGMLHAAIAPSAIAHGYLDDVIVDEALKMDGVHSVLTAADIDEGKNTIGVASADQPLLATHKVRWRGDRLALVAADTPRQARAAAEAVRGVYRELKPVFDVEEALAKGAPILHEKHKGKNLAAKGCVYKGNYKNALKGAEIIVEEVFDFGMQEHAYLETQGCLAVPEKDGRMTVYASMQCPFYVQEAVAALLNKPMSHVRVVQTVTGGAFGGKEDYPSEPAACAALLAHETGRPVKLIYNREEDMRWSSKRESQRVKHRLGAKKDGTIVGMEIEVFVDAGAYVGLAGIVAERSNASVVGPYRVPNVRVDTRTVYTCNAFSGAFRGFGHPQVAVATESQLDQLARELGMDAIEVRQKNLVRPGDTAPTGEVLGSPVEAQETLKRAAEMMNVAKVQKKIDAHNAKNERTRLGLGVSTISYGCCLHAGGQYLEGAGALVQIHHDASVSVAVGNTEMGQGATTVLAQIAADALGAKIEMVTMKQVDTDLVPDSGPTVASRTTTMSGNAVRDACAQLMEELRPVAAKLLGLRSSKDVYFLNGFARSKKKSKKIAYGVVVDTAYRQKAHLMKSGWYAPPRKVWDTKTGQGQPYSAYAYATQIALVEVDTFTGRSRVKKVTCAHDVGRALFPDGASGQIEGGVVQGMGYAMMERMVQVDGEIKNPNLTDYLIPSVLDAPDIEVLMLESCGVDGKQAAGPDGAKGVGEPSLIPICAAVGNAIANAVGKRVTQMPFMPELVLQALEEAGTGADVLAGLPE